MTKSIQQSTEKFHSEIKEMFCGEILTLYKAEKRLYAIVSEYVLDLLSSYLEEVDKAICADKSGRKQEGLYIQRRNDPRTVITRFGELHYHRTYYKDMVNDCYRHLADEVGKIEKYQRISDGLGIDLVKSATEMSYGKSIRREDNLH